MSHLRVILVNLLVIAILFGGGIGVFYYYTQATKYISTDNAMVTGRQINIVAPAAGRLSDWNGDIGKHYKAGERVGSIFAVPAGGTPTGGGLAAGVKVDITFPVDGTIVQQTAVKNSLVAAGTPLAIAYNLGDLNITANVKETDVRDIEAGQKVDVYVDAYPGDTLAGKVKKVGLATAATFSLLPSSNTTANYTKVTQVIPVIIDLDGYGGFRLVPGMSARVRIHK